MQPLSRTSPGDTCTIKWMFGVPEALKAMRDMDIHEGCTVKVVRKYRDCLVLGVRERRFVIGNEVAERIRV